MTPTTSAAESLDILHACTPTTRQSPVRVHGMPTSTESEFELRGMRVAPQTPGCACHGRVVRFVWWPSLAGRCCYDADG